MTRLAWITVGDMARLTGGYRYQAEVVRRLRVRGYRIDEISAAPAELAAQEAAVASWAAPFDPQPYAALVVDALARAVCAPVLDRWRAQRPVIAMIHELPSVAGQDSPAERAREAPVLRADQCLAVSADGAATLRARGVPAERITIASGGLDRVRAAAHPNPPAPPQRVLCVAQWIPRKGIRELVQAWSHVAQAGWRLDLVGETEADPAYAATVRAACANAPAGSIQIWGPLSDEDLAQAYQQATYFALPSHYEGYGLVFAEALWHGLPVLAGAVGPVPELVGAAGVLVAPDDPAALRAGLARLINEPRLRHALHRAALAQATRLPTWDTTAQQVDQAIQTVLARRTH